MKMKEMGNLFKLLLNIENTSRYRCLRFEKYNMLALEISFTFL